MTPNQIIEACGGIRELTALVLPFKQARALAALKRALQEELDAIIETLKLPTVDLSGQTSQLRISANAIMALEGIVIFDREETTT